MSERWKPEFGKEYYFVNGLGEVHSSYWYDDIGDISLNNVGNCFATEEEAEEVARTWKRLLNEYHENKKLNWSSSSKLMEMCTDALKNIGGLSDNSETAELPKWCKVGAWVYVSNNGYHKITCIETSGYSIPLIILDDGSKYIFGSLGWDDVSQACPRPYNEKEMEALVGKVLRHDTGGSYLVTAFNNRWNQIKIESAWRNAGELMEDWTWLDGKPCCKLVHKEGDDWVE